MHQLTVGIAQYLVVVRLQLVPLKQTHASHRYRSLTEPGVPEDVNSALGGYSPFATD